MNENEKVSIQIETTRRELLSHARNFLFAISELASDIDCLDFNGDLADLECDTLAYTASIKTLSEAAQTCLSYVSGEL